MQFEIKNRWTAEIIWGERQIPEALRPYASAIQRKGYQVLTSGLTRPVVKGESKCASYAQ